MMGEAEQFTLRSLFLLALVAASGCSHGWGPQYPPKPVCDICEEEDFAGFGTPSSKCGCCPWPCCCKCFEFPGEEPECREVLDIIWVLDSSGSIGEIDWIVAKQYVMDVVDQLDGIGSNQLVAMVTYSSNATLEWCFDGMETSSKQELTDAVQGLVLKGYFTNTVEALEVATECLESGANRPGVPNVCIVMTDGRTTHNVHKLPEVAAKFRAHCNKVVVIGVTSTIASDELNTISGNGHVFEVENFVALNDTLNEVRGRVCVGIEKPAEEKCFCCCTPAQFFGGGGSYYYSDYRYY